MYRPSHPRSYPRVEDAIDLGVALWRWLRLVIFPGRLPLPPRHR